MGKTYIGRGVIKTVCNLCGLTYRCSETDICPTCYEPMCPECFRNYSACCAEPPRPPSKLERSVIRVIQSLYASQQLSRKKAAEAAKKGQ